MTESKIDIARRLARRAGFEDAEFIKRVQNKDFYEGIFIETKQTKNPRTIDELLDGVTPTGLPVYIGIDDNLKVSYTMKLPQE